MSSLHEAPCRLCGSVLHSVAHQRIGWCQSAERFLYTEIPKNRLANVLPLDAMIGAIQAKELNSLVRGAMFSLNLEMFETKERDRMAWRAILEIDGRVSQHSRREQYSPSDGLRELHQLVMGVAPEDI